jgi:hypothetical protein
MNKYLKSLLIIILLSVVIYGSGRLYFAVTGGFTVGNITSDLTYHQNWATKPLFPADKAQLKQILSQKFSYLGKGCQSYVFASEDGKYVIKFVKYQRFRPQAWLDHFAFIPVFDRYRLGKIEKKEKKLNMLFESWKIAYDNLQPETGLIYVHLNKSVDLDQQLKIVDKIGIEHTLNLDDMEFMVQKRAVMLCETVNTLVAQGQTYKAETLISNLVDMVLNEYSRGFADNDHALMQNTGVFEGNPVHIDVGQFVINPEIVQKEVYKQELFSKTFKFRLWLGKYHPELAAKLNEKLYQIIGPEMDTLVPQLKNPHAWSVEG